MAITPIQLLYPLPTGLASIFGMAAGDQASAGGYNSAADGGGGLFTYSTAIPLPAVDNGAVFASSGAGVWLRQMAGQVATSSVPGGPAGAVSVKWWGALGTGHSSDAGANVIAFQAAINYAYGLETSLVPPGAVYIPSGTYYLNGTVTIKGDPAATVAIFGDGPGNTILYAQSKTGSSYTSLLLWAVQWGSSVQNWSIKNLSITGYSGSGLTLVDLSCGANHGVMEGLFVNGNSSTPTGIGIKVIGYVNSMRDCKVYDCATGYYLDEANGSNMERCYANSNTKPIDVEGARGLFINATWENNSGPVLLNDVSGATLYNCYAENNGTDAIGKNTQVIAGGAGTNDVLCSNIIIIGGMYFGGLLGSSPPANSTCIFEFANVDGYSIINPSVYDHQSGGRNVLRVNPNPSTNMGPNPGIVSFSQISAPWTNSPNASVVDQNVNYFANPNFDLGFDTLACYPWSVSPGSAAATLYNSGVGSYNADFVRYGLNSIQFKGPSTAAYAYLQFQISPYLLSRLIGKNVRATALVKCNGASYSGVSPSSVPVLGLYSQSGQLIDSGWTFSGLGTDWIFLVTGPLNLTSSVTTLYMRVSGCAPSGQTMASTDYLYIDSIWLTPANVSMQSLLCGNVKTLDCAKWLEYRTTSGAPGVTPLFVGEEVLDPTAKVWYKAKGPTSSDWQTL